jgi:hypothetical protein
VAALDRGEFARYEAATGRLPCATSGANKIQNAVDPAGAAGWQTSPFICSVPTAAIAALLACRNVM